MGNKSFALIAGLALVLSASAFLRPAQVDRIEVQKGPQGEKGEAGQNLGSFPGADVDSPAFSVNGVRIWNYSQSFNHASSTLCAFQSPSSTSTLLAAAANVFTGSSTAAVLLEVARNNVYDATTTNFLGGLYMAQNTKGVLLASTTPQNTQVGVFPPNTWLVFKAAFSDTIANSAGTNTLGGNCRARLMEI